MIAKLVFVNITGPKGDIDRIADKYISKREIHLEYAPSELKTISTLHPFVETNPYKSQINMADDLKEKFAGITETDSDMDVKEAAEFIEQFKGEIDCRQKTIGELEKERDRLSELKEKVSRFENLNYNVDDILKFDYLKYRFGRIPVEYYSKFLDFTEEIDNSVFIECSQDDKYVWGVYFVPKTEKESVDAAYTALHFERTFMPEQVTGTPREEIKKLVPAMEKNQENIKKAEADLEDYVQSNISMFSQAYNALKKFEFNFNVRKYAACTKQSGMAYYIICGWMEKKDAYELKEEIKQNEKETICIIDEKHETVDAMPPTKLKNIKLIKPYEMYIKMYGMPAYNEIDPTFFVALTYSFIFGAMFGDVGQGILLSVLGFLFYKVKKSNLGGIISMAGIFSTFFGFMFGSVFGFENIIDAVWLRPGKAMSDVPFIGRLNRVFVISIGFGMVLILVTMVMHIVNAIKAKDKKALLFDANGIAGIVFYGALALVIVLFVTGNPFPATAVLILLFVVPLILIAFKEPLMNLIEKKAEIMPKEKGMFFVQMFFEMFELLLSYFSNTLSFVRVGAFAVSHAAMMEVVLMLAGAENGTMGNPVVLVLGNLLVCGLEGLIVGIQVLRLEYYEMFSRFYKGNGYEFKAYGEKNK